EYLPAHTDRYLNVRSRRAVVDRARILMRVPSPSTTTPSCVRAATSSAGPRRAPGRPSVSARFRLPRVGLHCLLGSALCPWRPTFRTNMVPAFVLAGFLGAIAMNIGLSGALDGVDHELFTALTAQLFTLSFISIGLTPPPSSTR